MKDTKKLTRPEINELLTRIRRADARLRGIRTKVERAVAGVGGGTR